MVQLEQGVVKMNKRITTNVMFLIWVDVVFVGEYGGKKQKQDRLLPKIVIKEIKQM